MSITIVVTLVISSVTSFYFGRRVGYFDTRQLVRELNREISVLKQAARDHKNPVQIEGALIMELLEVYFQILSRFRCETTILGDLVNQKIRSGTERSAGLQAKIDQQIAHLQSLAVLLNTLAIKIKQHGSEVNLPPIRVPNFYTDEYTRSTRGD